MALGGALAPLPATRHHHGSQKCAPPGTAVHPRVHFTPTSLAQAPRSPRRPPPTAPPVAPAQPLAHGLPQGRGVERVDQAFAFRRLKPRTQRALSDQRTSERDGEASATKPSEQRSEPKPTSDETAKRARRDGETRTGLDCDRFLGADRRALDCMAGTDINTSVKQRSDTTTNERKRHTHTQATGSKAPGRMTTTSRIMPTGPAQVPAAGPPSDPEPVACTGDAASPGAGMALG